MNAQVQKLEALLARVQENRKKPRVAVAAPVAAAPAVAPEVAPRPRRLARLLRRRGR